MMQIKNKSGRKYISNVKRHLKCSIKLRCGFVDVLRNELYNFELDNPDASYSDYTAAFGAPEDTAKSYLGELSRRERAAYWLPLAAVLGVVAASAFLFLSVLLISQQEDRGSYMVIEFERYVSASDILEYDD